MLRFRGRERVVHGIEALGLLIPFQQREVNDPQYFVFAGFAQTETVAHFQTERAQLGACLHGLARHDEDKVAGVRFTAFGHRLQIVLVIELVHGGFECAVSVAQDID